ncbi:Uncharacterised protein [Chlamydia abortus]|nr:Uncharacterised protein [Chlamydia abortus]
MAITNSPLLQNICFYFMIIIWRIYVLVQVEKNILRICLHNEWNRIAVPVENGGEGDRSPRPDRSLEIRRRICYPFA